MNLILHDLDIRKEFFPFTLSRPLPECRLGILTFTEKWSFYFNNSISFCTAPHLSAKYSQLNSSGSDKLIVSGNLIPDFTLADAIQKLEPESTLWHNGTFLAARTVQNPAEFSASEFSGKKSEYTDVPKMIRHLWEFFTLLGEEIKSDFNLITKGRKSEPLHSSVTLIGNHPVFLESGAKIYASVINTEAGPVYLAKNAEIMEGCLIRGPFALGDGAALKMGAKIYGPTSVGPHSKIGGEVNNSNIFGFSNKAHDGFLGNSVIGEWCNLGADSNNSNLKNNYGEVKIHHIYANHTIGTGLQFCGLFMGDHSKCGINTMFNTGTVTGFSANIFDSGFPPKFIQSFSWGGRSDSPVFELNKAIELAKNVMSRRNLEFSESDKEIFTHLFNHRHSPKDC